ncbi:uncharacterized protein HGUI_01303 [Hanseniaspora guilliermondii]|uniref:Pre-rRNA-processing protein FHL1 n=1 Tax=Hanseniaspora guilliermondii TaxID=56406 RepID=A0A1L0CWB5_9ASCO|nr:uncharacterized protein HGUI_01303 [Hanseniaspora guilliermondii]
MDFINSDLKFASKSNKDNKQSEKTKDDISNNDQSLKARRDSTSMLLTAALGDFDSSNLRQSRLSMSMFEEDHPVRDSLRSMSQGDSNMSNNLTSSGPPLSKSNPEETTPGVANNGASSNNRRFSNLSLAKRNSFLRDSIDLNAEMMVGAFGNKSSKENSHDSKVPQSSQNDEEFLRFGLHDINKNPNSTSPYMGASQHKPSIGFSNRKISFGGLVNGRKDSINMDGVMESFLSLNGKDDDMFLSQRRNSSLTSMIRPSIIGLEKYKSLQNENAISDGDDDQFDTDMKERLKIKSKTNSVSTTNEIAKNTPNQLEPAIKSTPIIKSVTDNKPASTIEKQLTTPSMIIKKQEAASSVNPSSIKDNTILESTKKMSIPNTLNVSDADISAYARLDFADSTFYVQTLKVTIGRKPTTNDPSQTGVVTAQQYNYSNKDNVDVNLGTSKSISRKHAQIYYNFNNEKFEMTVLGKNGAFVNDEFIGKDVTVALSNDTKIQIANIPFVFVQDASSIPEYSKSGDRFKTKEEIDVANTIKKEKAKKALNEKKKENQKKKKEQKAALELLAKQQQQQQDKITPVVFTSTLTAKKPKAPSAAAKAKAARDAAKNASKALKTTIMPSHATVGTIKPEKTKVEQSFAVISPKETVIKKPKKKEYLPDEIPEQYRQKPDLSYQDILLEVFKKVTFKEGDTLSLSNIYEKMKEMYPYYEYCNKGWQSSVRNALQSGKYFKKGPKEGKSWLWMLDYDYIKTLREEERKEQEEKQKIENANKEAKRKFFQRLPKQINLKETNDSKQKRTLVYLQEQLLILTTDRQGLDKETISKVLTKALASTIQKVNEVSKKIGMTKNPLGFLMDKNPQQLNYILAAACNASLREVTGDKSSQIVKLPTPQELERDLDEAKKEYFQTTGDVWVPPKEIKPPPKKLTPKQQERMKTTKTTAGTQRKTTVGSSAGTGVKKGKISMRGELKFETSEHKEIGSSKKNQFGILTMKADPLSSSTKSEGYGNKSSSSSVKRKGDNESGGVYKKVKVDMKHGNKQPRKKAVASTSVISVQPTMKNTSISSEGKQVTTTTTLPKSQVVPSTLKMNSKETVTKPSTTNFDPASLSKFFQARNLKSTKTISSKSSSPQQVKVSGSSDDNSRKPSKTNESTSSDDVSSDEDSDSDDD